MGILSCCSFVAALKMQQTLKHWRPGLVVMVGDSCSNGREFKFRHRILDGHFFTFICCKNCNVCLKKRPGLAHYFKKTIEILFWWRHRRWRRMIFYFSQTYLLLYWTNENISFMTTNNKSYYCKLSTSITFIFEGISRTFSVFYPSDFRWQYCKQF